MTLEALRDSYNRLPEPHGLGRMELGRVTIDTKPIHCDPLQPAESAAIIDQAIRDFAPTAGWLCYQSQVIRLGLDETQDERDDRGLLLSGELVNGNPASLHIRQNGSGGWLLTYFTPDTGDRYLTDTLSLLAFERDPERRSNPTRLRYRRYWALDPVHGVRQVAACFIGFAGGS